MNTKQKDMTPSELLAASFRPFIGGCTHVDEIVANMVKAIDNTIASALEGQQPPPLAQPTFTGDGYNFAPDGLKEIPLEDWMHGMFMYCISKPDSRQARRLHGGVTYDIRLYEVPNFADCQDKIGYAIVRDWFDHTIERNREKTIYRFCRYGSDAAWRKFTGRFAAQFAGDNS
jgi:hypothetical protein